MSSGRGMLSRRLFRPFMLNGMKRKACCSPNAPREPGRAKRRCIIIPLYRRKEIIIAMPCANAIEGQRINVSASACRRIRGKFPPNKENLPKSITRNDNYEMKKENLAGWSRRNVIMRIFTLIIGVVTFERAHHRSKA